MEKVRAHAYVSGLVQGVFFRANTVDAADRIGRLSGWVRNLPDGRVEVVCEGERDRVEKLVDWLGQGPPAARVTDVQISWEEPSDSFDGFHVKY